MLQFHRDRADAAALLAHLHAADARFVPPLSQRVRLPDYAAKLATQALREEAWADGALVGLIAWYGNDAEAGGYISNVSVLDGWRGQGLADRLLQSCVARAREGGLPRLSLHLHPDNAPALALYRRHGFVPGPLQDAQLTMTLPLRP